jgi:hypothetical protein
LFPTFFPLAGGTGSARLLTDPQVFTIAANYQPDAAAQSTIEQWIPAGYLPVTTPTTGFNAVADNLTNIFFMASRDSVMNALATQQIGALGRDDARHRRVRAVDDPRRWQAADVHRCEHNALEQTRCLGQASAPSHRSGTVGAVPARDVRLNALC